MARPKKKRTKKATDAKKELIKLLTKVPRAPAKYGPRGNSWDPDREEDFERHVNVLTNVYEQVKASTEQEATRFNDIWRSAQVDPSVTVEDMDSVHDYVDEPLRSTSAADLWNTLLHVVAIYHGVETAIGAAIEWRLKTATHDVTKKVLYVSSRIDNQKVIFKTLFPFELPQLPGWKEVSDLRLITNATKHAGGGTPKKLADRWNVKVNEPIPAAKIDVPKLRAGAVRYVTAIFDHIVVRQPQST